MQTQVIKVDPKSPEENIIKEAGDIIREGGLVAFPTETVYGLGGDALDPEASKKIYAAKGRPSDNPLIVHIADIEALDRIVTEVPEAARKLAKAWWPGPLTMIFNKTKAVPDETSGGLDTVAVRMPDHPVAAALIRAGGGYIAAPSANTSGRPSPTTAQHVKEDLDGKIPVILDAGPVKIGLESTIVDFTEEIPVILRPGFINKAMLQDVLGEVKMDPGLSSENENIRPKAPGMRYRHYAPKASLTIVEGDSEAVIRRILALAAEEEAQGRTVGLLVSDETADRYEPAETREPAGKTQASAKRLIRAAGHMASEEEIAHNLYALLREFDERGVDVIYSEAFDAPQLGDAIMNRLIKAAGHHVIEA